MRTAGLALATTSGAARSIEATLRSPDLGGEHRLQLRVRAAGAAAQALVVQLDDLAHERPKHRAGRLVHPLHVAEMARILHRDPEVERLDVGEASDVRSEPLLDVEDPRGERMCAAPVPSSRP